MAEDVLQRSEPLDELNGRLRTHAPDTRDVVGTVAHQGEVVGHTLRRHAQALRGVALVDHLLLHRGRAAPPGVEEFDAAADQLVEVLVARDDDRPQPRVRRLSRQSADDIVGFETLQLDHRDSKASEDLTNPSHGGVEILLQGLVELLPRGLVVLVDLVPERLLTASIEDESDVVRPVLAQDLADELCDAPRGRGVLAAGGAQRPADHGVERPVDQGVAVDQVEARAGLVGQLNHSHDRLGEHREDCTVERR